MNALYAAWFRREARERFGKTIEELSEAEFNLIEYGHEAMPKDEVRRERHLWVVK